MQGWYYNIILQGTTMSFVNEISKTIFKINVRKKILVLSNEIKNIKFIKYIFL